MKIIIIDDRAKLQEENKKQYKIPFIWFTTHEHPREQKKRGDNEPFIYLLSTKNQGEGS